MWTLRPADFQSCFLFSESSFHQANETLISTLCRGDELLPYKTSVKVLPTDSVVSSQTAKKQGSNLPLTITLKI